jgi:hypothetical protein
MKGFFVAFALSLCTLASATIYYVQDPAYNDQASDMNAGTDINRPWATWQKAFNTARAGDTVYFRGGVWYPRSDIYGNVTMHYPANGNGHNGRYGRPVCFFAYPPDVEEGNMPVLDCRYTNPSTINHVGLYISDSRHVQFKGLTITNVQSLPRGGSEMWCAGIMAHGFEHLTLEQMTTSYIGGVGMMTIDHDTLYLINCDSHNNCDSLDVSMPGNDGDGYCVFEETPQYDTTQFVYIAGCRAWNNSDDGFNITTRKHLVMHDNWSWDNGDLEGDANGYKMSLSHLKTTWKRQIYNNISASNEAAGFIDLNLDENIGPFYEYLNNTSYLDGQGFGSGKGEVFNCSSHPASVIYRNNISYATTGSYPAQLKACDYGYPSYVTQDHNTWIQTGEYFYTTANPAYSVSESDFQSLNIDQLGRKRKADGSLPDIEFMKLRSNSDLIDRGIDVGQAYFGPAPDLGAFETGAYSVKLITPDVFSEFLLGDDIVIRAKVGGESQDVQEVLFYTEDRARIIGQGTQVSDNVWEISWESDEIGFQELRAEAIGHGGEVATSNILRIQVMWQDIDTATEYHNENSCKIMPNPNDGFFSLELQEPLKESSDIQVFSMSGKLVAIERMDQDEMIKQMDVSALPPGIYNIQLGQGKNASGIKMVKN